MHPNTVAPPQPRGQHCRDETLTTRHLRASISNGSSGLADRLGDLESEASKLRYLGDVSQFYEHLQRRGKPRTIPPRGSTWCMGGERSEHDNPALSSEQVRQLYDAVESPDEDCWSSRCVDGACVATRLRACTSPSSSSRAMIHTFISRNARTALVRSRCSMAARRLPIGSTRLER